MWALFGRRRRFFHATYVRYVGRTLFFGPVLVGSAAAWLFASVPQLREVYLGLVETSDVPRALGGMVALMLLSALLYAWNQRLSTLRIDAIYPLHADIYFDRNILRIRNMWGGLCALLPLAGLVIGLALASWQAAGAVNNVQTLLDSLAARSTEYAQLGERLQLISAATFGVCWFLAAVAAVYMRILFVASDSDRLQSWILRVAYGVAAVMAAGPIALPDQTLTAARLAGPLAVCGLVLVAGTVLLRLLVQAVAYLLKQVAVAGAAIVMALTWLPIPAKWAAVGLVIIVSLLGLARQPGGVSPIDRNEARAWLPERAQTDIAARFEAWLDARKDRSAERDYPVFIVAAQGGGIYAASATAALLSGLQDRCSNFAQHVFAISAVSGGAVGSSIFNAIVAETGQREATGCQPSASPPLSTRSKDIILADHLSPLIARLVPDFILDFFLPDGLGRFFPAGSGINARRQDLLETGLVRTYAETAAGSGGTAQRSCPLEKKPDVRGLAAPFHTHWCLDSAAPALVLNSTWVETGYRVAFAPFPLPQSDGTLYGFSELQRTAINPDHSLSLIRAAVISARYPLITSPWYFVRRPTTPSDPPGDRWTFVDGGYADNSGATTALDLFRAIDTHIKARNLKVDLRLIVLTDALAEPAFTQGSGSWFGDILSPISAVLNVRSLLARRAVTQAVNHINDEERLIRIQLEQRIFPLPLGWKISASANAIVALSIGQPELCPGGESPNRASSGGTPADTVRENSCKMRKLLALLARGS